MGQQLTSASVSSPEAAGACAPAPAAAVVGVAGLAGDAGPGEFDFAAAGGAGGLAIAGTGAAEGLEAAPFSVRDFFWEEAASAELQDERRRVSIELSITGRHALLALETRCLLHQKTV
jgi:hypothetical protein